MFWGRFARVYDQYSDLNENKEDNFKEKFKLALTSTAKVISDDYTLDVDKKNKKFKFKKYRFL